MYTDPNSTLVVKWYFPTFSHTQNQIYDILVKKFRCSKNVQRNRRKKKMYKQKHHTLEWEHRKSIQLKIPEKPGLIECRDKTAIGWNRIMISVKI